MAWQCPLCGSLNKDSLVRCVCGNDITVENQGKYTVASEADRLKEQGQDMQGQSREFALEFHGSAWEYFRIWVVNLCLTLLTVGIFSAWAKVRKKRYFYSRTMLGGTPFQYLGQPIPILKGRVIAAIAFSLYYLSSRFFTSLLPYVLVAGVILAPWVIVRSAAFNARYSAFRNMTFRFDGTYVAALKVVHAWGLVPALIAAMIFSSRGKVVVAGVLFAIFALSFPWWIRRLKKFIIECTSYGGRKGEFFATGGDVFKVYFIAGVIVVSVGIIAVVLMAALLPMVKKSQVLLLMAALPIYVGYVLAFAYVQAHMSNVVWNHTRLGPLRFQSTLLARGMAKLYLTNALAIIASLGLLTPWAVMRTLRYRAENMRAVLDGNLTDFQGGESGAVRAVGAELVDFFDLDVSL